jgi:hypothetical protein
LRGARFANPARRSLQRPGSAGNECLPKPDCRPPLAVRASLSPAPGHAKALRSVWKPSSWNVSANCLKYWLSPSSFPSNASADSPARCGCARSVAGEIRPSRALYAQAEARHPFEDRRDQSISAAPVCRGIDGACLLKAGNRRGRVLPRGVERRGSWTAVHASNWARGIKPSALGTGAPPGRCRA